MRPSRRATAARVAHEELSAIRQELESKLASTESSLADGSARFEALRQAGDAEREMAAKEREELTSRIEHLGNDLTARDAEIAAAKTKLEEATAREEELKRQLASRESDIAAGQA